MIVGVLLAAGASTRMGRPKALVSAGGESFIARGIRHLWSACDRVVIVLGAEAPRIRRATERELERLAGAGRLVRDGGRARGGEPNHLEACFVVNRAWKRGMLSSAGAGLREALRAHPEAVLVMPVDHPAVRSGTVADLGRVLLEALAACRTPRARARFSYALIPRFRRRRGHPIALSPALARAVVADTGAEHLSDAIRRNARLVGYLDVSDAGVVRNRNTPRD
jgi:CTP:molybdopterin cytidylyltransferase MocA